MDSSLHTLVVGKSSYSDGDEENAKEQVETVYRTYKIRFFGLTVIALSNIASSMNWSCVSPVPDVADKFFNNIGLTAINWFANVFMLTYLVAGPFSSWVYTRTSVKMGIVIGASLQVIGAWLRYCSTFIGSSTGKFALAIIGQAICAFGQPFILNAGTPYVALWFSAKGRATASMVGGIANAVGQAVASIVIPAIVKDTSTLPFGFLVVACVTTGITILVFLIPEKPKVPPGAAASSRNGVDLTFGKSLYQLVTNWNYLIVFIAFAIISGLASGMTSLLTQIVTPYGISNSNAGLLGAAFIVAGLVGCILTAIFLDKVGYPKAIVKIYVPIVGAAYLALYFVVPKGQYAPIIAVCAIMGYFTFSLLPTAIELSIESTYPISEAISSPLLWMGNQVTGFIIMQVVNALRSPDGTYTHGLLFAACICLPLTILSTIYNAPNKRAEFERQNKAVSNEV